MQPHLEVDFGHLPYDSTTEAAAREGVAMLHRDCSGVGACHVTIAGPADGHHLWQPPHVQITVDSSGAAMSVDQESQNGDTAEITVRRAFGMAHQLLLELAGKGDAVASEDHQTPPAQLAP